MAYICTECGADLSQTGAVRRVAQVLVDEDWHVTPEGKMDYDGPNKEFGDDETIEPFCCRDCGTLVSSMYEDVE